MQVRWEQKKVTIIHLVPGATENLRIRDFNVVVKSQFFSPCILDKLCHKVERVCGDPAESATEVVRGCGLRPIEPDPLRRRGTCHGVEETG